MEINGRLWQSLISFAISCDPTMLLLSPLRIQEQWGIIYRWFAKGTIHWEKEKCYIKLNFKKIYIYWNSIQGKGFHFPKR